MYRKQGKTKISTHIVDHWVMSGTLDQKSVARVPND
jgi:hypothetical protein